MKTNLDSFFDFSHFFGPAPDFLAYLRSQILTLGFRRKNVELANMAAEIAFREHPLTLRGLFYRVVSLGGLPSTDKKQYNRLNRILTKLREGGAVPFSWIVDNVRSTIKPSSWSGLPDFVETVEQAYRMDFWARLPAYVHVICEKDAIAGVLASVTREYDVALSPVRGYCSLTFAHEIASLWNRIDKPIYAYYLGDYDPSGFDLERDLRERLQRYCRRPFVWERLGVLREDFAEFDLMPLKPKVSDRRYAKFLRTHGRKCAELDALPAPELRSRVETAIDDHIPQDEWSKLKELERVQRESFRFALVQFKKAA